MPELLGLLMAGAVIGRSSRGGGSRDAGRLRSPPNSWAEATALALPPSASDRGGTVAWLLLAEPFRPRGFYLRKPTPSLRIVSLIMSESPLGPSAP